MKELAWDSVGLDFWKLGRRTAKPNEETIKWYLENVKSGDYVLVVGGTTIDLINSFVETGAHVYVADFSKRICNELKAYVPHNVSICNVNILNPPFEWLAKFDLVASDTLINRFDYTEAVIFEQNVRNILKIGGMMKSTVKIGLYEMDYNLIRLAKKRGYSLSFWDAPSKTIDYSLAKEILYEGVLPHGDISKDVLISWYSNRGREKRFDVDDIRLLFDEWSSVEIEKDYKDRVRVKTIK
jgi:hypothetical protein